MTKKINLRAQRKAKAIATNIAGDSDYRQTLQAGRDITRNARAAAAAREDDEDINGRPIQTRVAGARNLETVGQQRLYIEHVPTGFTVTFPAFITAFGDAYNSSWNSEKVYGRMDPMATFMHTKRAISLAWEVPAESYEHAMRNLFKINKLISFLYPLYAQSSRDKPANPQDAIGVINQDPMWKVKFGNLIQNSQTGGALLGFVNGITMDPMVENGFFYGMTPEGKAEYYPKAIRLNFEFVVTHEHSLGFEASTGKRKPVKVKSIEDGMSRTQITYRFNDPKLNFGNFPYVTDQFATAVRSEGATVPVNAASAVPADLPEAGSAVEESQFQSWLWQIDVGEEKLSIDTINAGLRAGQITLREKWQLYEFDQMVNLDRGTSYIDYGGIDNPAAYVAITKRTRSQYNAWVKTQGPLYNRGGWIPRP